MLSAIALPIRCLYIICLFAFFFSYISKVFKFVTLYTNGITLGETEESCQYNESEKMQAKNVRVPFRAPTNQPTKGFQSTRLSGADEAAPPLSPGGGSLSLQAGRVRHELVAEGDQ